MMYVIYELNSTINSSVGNNLKSLNPKDKVWGLNTQLNQTLSHYCLLFSNEKMSYYSCCESSLTPEVQYVIRYICAVGNISHSSNTCSFQHAPYRLGKYP